MSAPPHKQTSPSYARRLFSRKVRLTPIQPALPQTSTPDIIHTRTSSLSSLTVSLSESPDIFSQSIQRHSWGAGLFQCQYHLNVLVWIDNILKLRDDETLWQPLDPLESREKLDAGLVDKLVEHCLTGFVEDEEERDMMMILGAMAFMRLGCRIPIALKSFVASRATIDPSSATLKLQPQSINQIQRALDKYKPGAFHIFEGAELEMIPLLAETQNDWDDRELGDIDGKNGRDEDDDYEWEDDSAAASSLRRIASIESSRMLEKSGVVAGIKELLRMRGKKKFNRNVS